MLSGDTIAARLGRHELTLEQLLLRALATDDLSVIDKWQEACLLEDWADSLGIRLPQSALQQELNTFRTAQGLFTGEATRRWLAERQLTLQGLADLLRPQLLRACLMEQVVREEEIDRYFHEHRSMFDRAAVSRLLAATYGQARELWYRLEEGADFHQLARRYSVEETTRPAGGFAGVQSRETLGSLADAVFASAADEVLPPVETQEGWLLVYIDWLVKVELDDETKAHIRHLLFERKWQAYCTQADRQTLLWQRLAASVRQRANNKDGQKGEDS